MTNEELDRLEALAKKATPGPWHVNRRDEVCMRLSDGTSFAIADSYGGGGDSAFIAAASPDVALRLVAELREARAEVERLRAMVPSEDELTAIRDACDLYRDDALPWERETIDAWLTRFESAKEAGR